MQYCPRCATPLVDSPQAGRPRPTCPRCGFVYFADPKVAVAVVIERAGALLLGRRVNTPGQGKWSLPAGYVDRGEVVEEAAAREAHEELGVAVTIGRLIGLYSSAGDPVILVVYAAVIQAGEPIAGDDLDAVGYFALDALPDLAFPRDREILAAWAKGRE